MEHGRTGAAANGEWGLSDIFWQLRLRNAGLSPLRCALQQIAADAAAGRLDVKPTRIFRFEEIREAHRVMEANEARGKMVVVHS